MASGAMTTMSTSTGPISDRQYRMKVRDLANRDRTKGIASWAVDVTHEITITPNGGFTYDRLQDRHRILYAGRNRPQEGEIVERGHRRYLSMWPPAWLCSRPTILRMAIARSTRTIRRPTSKRPTSTIRSSWAASSQVIPKAVPRRELHLHPLYFGMGFGLHPGRLPVHAAGGLPGRAQHHEPGRRAGEIHARRLVHEKCGLCRKSLRKGSLAVGEELERLLAVAAEPVRLLVNPTNLTTEYSIWMANGNPNYDVVLGQLSFGVKW